MEIVGVDESRPDDGEMEQAVADAVRGGDSKAGYDVALEKEGEII